MPNHLKRTAALLTVALLLCGCNSPVSPAEEVSAPTEISEPPRTSAPVKEMSVSSEKQSDTLDTVSFKKLTNAQLRINEKIRELAALPDTLTYDNIHYVSDEELGLSDRYPNARSSCREMGENAFSDAKKMVSPMLLSDDNMMVYDLTLKIGEMDSAYLIPVESVKAAYYLYFDEPRVFRGFLCQTVSGVECVLDPAYMDGIPVFSSDEKDLTFSINGQTMIADTISLTFENDVIEPIVGAGNDRYVYAEFSFFSLEVSYNTESGYGIRGHSLTDVKLLTEDTASVLSGDFIFGQESESAGEAELLYRGLTENFDTLHNGSACGLVLLDMDFDGSPEVLVSRKGSDEENVRYADVDVYRFEDGSFVYLDTIRSIAHSAYGENSDCSAYLGLKTLSDGSKAWFGMTNEYILGDEKGGHLESGKLFRLENGKIREEEVFSNWQKLGESGGLMTYIDGKPMDSVNDDSERFDHKSYFDLKNSYCADIEEKIFLYSDWLIPITKLKDRRYFGTGLLSPSARDTAIQLGRLVDSYYYGDYSGEDSEYVYNFYELPAMKPVIYLYPEAKTEVSVSVDFPRGDGITCSYPVYDGGWRVIALPDGTLFDENGNEYYCLYWEGEDLPLSDLDEGWCVPGEDTADFLREKLLEIGLTAREANEMIIYWLPQMQEKPYNLISFHFEDYDRSAPLTVSPAPDTLIRVFMTYSPCEEWVEIEPQVLPRYMRRGFTAVEWGGCELRVSE